MVYVPTREREKGGVGTTFLQLQTKRHYHLGPPSDCPSQRSHFLHFYFLLLFDRSVASMFFVSLPPTNNRPNIPNHSFVSRTPKVIFFNLNVRIFNIHHTTYIIYLICNIQSRTYNQSIHKKTHNACCDLILFDELLGNLHLDLDTKL